MNTFVQANRIGVSAIIPLLKDKVTVSGNCWFLSLEEATMKQQAMKCSRRSAFSCSSLGTLNVIVFVVGMSLLAYNIFCLQPYIDELQLEVDVFRRELRQIQLDESNSTYDEVGRTHLPDSTLGGYQMSQLSGQNNVDEWAVLEEEADQDQKHTKQLERDVDEDAEREEDDDALDNVDLSGQDERGNNNTRQLMGEQFNRSKRDVPSRGGHKRGRRRGRLFTKKPLIKRKKVKAIHLESYLTDDEWSDVLIKVRAEEITYGHGRLTQQGFTPFSHTYQFWQLADWCKRGSMFATYLDCYGHVEITKEGLYYLYAQVMYHDLTGTYAYGIFVNEKMVFQCMVTRSVNSSEKQLGDRHVVYEQCFTGGVVKLEREDRLSIRDLHPGSLPKVLMNLDYSTYWGIIKLY